MKQSKTRVVQNNEGAIKALKGYLEYLNYTNPAKCKEIIMDTFLALGLKLAVEQALQMESPEKAVKNTQEIDHD